jgi:hypothetical protein
MLFAFGRNGYRLKGTITHGGRAAIVRDAALRAAPQDEGREESGLMVRSGPQNRVSNHGQDF